MIIQNYSDLAKNKLRKDALDILISGVKSVLPRNFFPKYVKFEKCILSVCSDKFDISKGNLYVIGGGKAAGAMAQEIENIIPLGSITSGIVNDKTDSITKKIKINIASHPLPDENSILGVKEMLDLTKNLKKEDIVMCLISGGGSALMSYPIEGIILEEMKKMTELLLKSGAEVYEINVIRKHISRIKGGKLLRYLQPAKIISIILSDTLNQNDATASGPTCPDESTYELAYDILRKYSLLEKAPKSIVNHIKKGVKGEVEETVKKGDGILSNVHNYVLADNDTALETMEKKAKELGYNTEVYPEKIVGEAKDEAKKMAVIFQEKYNEKKGKFALLCGGETTVTVKGNGKGGRNQEYITSLIKEISSIENCAVASIGSDGVDFIEGVGGAIADNKTYQETEKQGLNISEFLDCNNTFLLHKKLNNLILTSPSNTNVTDLQVYLQEKK